MTSSSGPVMNYNDECIIYYDDLDYVNLRILCDHQIYMLQDQTLNISCEGDRPMKWSWTSSNVSSTSIIYYSSPVIIIIIIIIKIFASQWLLLEKNKWAIMSWSCIKCSIILLLNWSKNLFIKFCSFVFHSKRGSLMRKS